MRWSFWIACGIAVVGGVAPFLLGGASNRLNGVVFPFGLAAIVFGACAMLFQRGKGVATSLYLVASLAIVYGILAMVEVPLRLAVVGICPPGLASCPLGFERPMTSGETTALSFAIGMGIVALVTASFGLVTLYHMLRPPSPSGSGTAAVDTRTPAEAAPPPLPALPTTAQPESAAQSEVSSPQPELELPAHEPDLELPAHAPEPQIPDRPPQHASDPSSVSPPHAPQREPRRKRGAKPAPDSPTAPTSESPG
ncbi:MAG: hypothetical protein ACYDA0_03305 [Candidatus Dormibacteraceae bacterium]